MVTSNTFSVSTSKLVLDFIFKVKTGLLFDGVAIAWVYLGGPQPIRSIWSDIIWNIASILLIGFAVLQVWTMKRAAEKGQEAYEETGATLFTFMSLLWAIWTAFTVQQGV